MVADLKRLKGQPIEDAEFEIITGRVTDLVRDIHRNVGQFNKEGAELAELASEIRRLGRKVEKPMPAVRQIAIPALSSA